MTADAILTAPFSPLSGGGGDIVMSGIRAAGQLQCSQNLFRDGYVLHRDARQIRDSNIGGAPSTGRPARNHFSQLDHCLRVQASGCDGMMDLAAREALNAAVCDNDIGAGNKLS